MQQGTRVTTRPAAEQLHDDVLALRPLIESSASGNDEATEISCEVQEALEEIGLFRLMAPADLGGFEAHPLTVLDVLKTLSYLDGSTGWYAQAATTGVAVAGSMLGDRAIDAIFGSGKRATCAGQAAPTGKAERIGDSYRVAGSFSFGSGIPNASWIVGGYILHEDGRPKLDPLRNPVMLIGVVARENVELRGNWNVLGLRGTGSYDFHVPEQAVHQDYFFDPATAAPLRGGALYRMGFLAIPALCHASFGSGCSLRMLDEWALYARGKRRGPGKTISEMDTFRRDFAVSTAAHRSAEEYVRSTYRQLFASATVGGPSPQQVLDSQLSASNMITVGTRIAQTAFTSSATTGLRNGSVLQRGFRDMQAANAHILTSEQSYIDAGARLATEPPYICGSTPNS